VVGEGTAAGGAGRGISVAERLYRRLGGGQAPAPGEPCTAQTLCCDFVNLGPGYERPACCTDHLICLMEFVHTLLEQHQITHWLEFGSLLGAVRDGHLIPWDPDVDFGILLADVERVLALGPEIERAGHRLDTSHPGMLQIMFSARNARHLDLFPFRIDAGIVTMAHPVGYNWPGTAGTRPFPVSYIEAMGPVVVEGLELPAPSPVERFLIDHRFGEGFRTPQRPVLHGGLVPAISPDDVTPGLRRLFQEVGRSEAELLAVERPRGRGLASLAAWDFWVRAAMPVTPARDRVARLAGTWDVKRGGEAAEQLLTSLALLEQTLEELASRGGRTRVVRAGRRARAVVRRALRVVEQRSLRG
jgi:LicD family protein